MKDFLAIGKTRDRTKGKDVIYHFNDIVNCIHTAAGYSSLNMGVFIAEFNMRTQIPYNTDIEGNCSCIKANYYKMGGQILSVIQRMVLKQLV